MAKKENTRKNKHLTADERKEIEECLSKRMTFKAIGKLIGKDPTTISYEVKHHKVEHRNNYVTENGTCPELLRPPFVHNGSLCVTDPKSVPLGNHRRIRMLLFSSVPRSKLL